MPSPNFKKILIFCLSLSFLSIAGVLFLQKNLSLPPVVPLLYGLPVSKEQLVPTIGLTIPSMISIAFIAINFTIIKITKDKFLEKILGGLTITCTLLALITIINITTLVTT